MDIYEYLKKDHRKVGDLLERTGAASSNDERMRLFKEIYNDVLLHAETEEATFYRALTEKGDKHIQEKEEHAEEEHAEIRKHLKECDSKECGSKSWMLSFGELKHAIEHHVEEEEGEIFKKARNIISEKEAEKLAQEMDDLKQRRSKKNHVA